MVDDMRASSFPIETGRTGIAELGRWQGVPELNGGRLEAARSTAEGGGGRKPRSAV
jgi:hypothetical protein